jgi:hypothetical protein
VEDGPRLSGCCVPTESVNRPGNPGGWWRRLHEGPYISKGNRNGGEIDLRRRVSAWSQSKIRVSLVALGLIGLGTVMAGCSSSGSTAASKTPLSEVAIEKTSGPAICGHLASDAALRRLPAALSRLEVPSEWTAGRQVVTESQSDLKGMAGSAPRPLAAAMEATANALDPLAISAPTQPSINRVVGALDVLATTGQQVCSFGSP